MSSERRLFLALLLSIVFCAIWAHWMQEKQHKLRQQNADKQQQNPQPADKPVPIPQDKPDEIKPDPVIAAPILHNASELGMATEEQRIEVDTARYRMVWTNRGASMVMLKLKEYCHNYSEYQKADALQNPDNWLDILPEFSGTFGSLLTFAEDHVSIDNQISTIKLENSLWQVTQYLQEQPARLEFTLGPLNGVKYTKIFTFSDEYSFKYQLILHNTSAQAQTRTLQQGSGFGINIEGAGDQELQLITGHAMYLNPKLQPLYKTFSYSDMVKENVKFKESVSWVGMVNRYFGYLLTIDDPSKITEVVAKSLEPGSTWIKDMMDLKRSQGESVKHEELQKQKHSTLVLQTGALQIPPQDQLSLGFTFLIDSKLNLSQKDKTYNVIDDYGFFGVISHLLLWILNFFYNIFHNYGVAIICLTLVVKGCMYPITKKQQISMHNFQTKMKKFQPQLKKLQEKYKGDRQKLNQEVMKLYKEHGVSPFPLGGCLPIFLQLPIFIGLYSALSYSISLRQASFLWISDLAQPDRLINFGSYVWFLGDYLNILPIVMTVIWVVQQKLAPKSDDPQMQQQQKMMSFMVIFFGFMFYHIASGLVLYWTVMNIFSIAEQVVIKKMMAEKSS